MPPPGAIPSNHRLWSDEDEGVAPSPPAMREKRPKHPVVLAQSGTVCPSAIDSELLPQREVFLQQIAPRTPGLKKGA